MIPLRSIPSCKVTALWRLVPLPVLTLSGCTRAPLQDVLGSFFPSWMLCATLGAVGAALLRALLGVFNLQQSVPAPMLTYLAFMVAVTFLVWLVFFGH
ncbi:YtcA family lipoprotein [Asaia prunellae]|uniref:YtcA family lipoprotein n=1 Tax=Asaia prunellae TaxID=610245 RepID=UPI0011DCB64B|nr:YtcA family lipoprotein [Asaia prunellae]